MTLNQAFVTGQIPQIGIHSVALFDRAGRLVGFYVDPQADYEWMTLQ
jgi:hypothetical protein